MVNPKSSAEPILEPDLPIVDAHHHLWVVSEGLLNTVMGVVGETSPLVTIMRNTPLYLLEELLADCNTGHNVIATVFMEAHTMYRQSGPASMRSVGEVEFANGIAAMAESGTFGPVKACAEIVGNVNLTLGDAVEEILHAHIQAGNGRYRGVRHGTTHNPDPGLRQYGMANAPHLLADKAFRAGFKWIHKFGLSGDVGVVEPQLPELVDFARAFPETPIILNHVAVPLGQAGYAGKRPERFPIWRDNMRTLATCGNVTVKLGGLGMPTCGFAAFMSDPPATSEQIAAEWKPYIETCIEAFGANRCMFESNFPFDSGSCTYPVLWNTFKRITAGASKDEKAALYSGTAKRVYRLDI